MSQNFGSAKKEWRDQGRFKSANRKYHPKKHCSQDHATQRSSHNDHWRRPDYRGYENDYSKNFAAESSSVVETGGGGGGGPGVGIFITPYYTDFGNTPNSWNSSYGYNGFQNNKLDASGEMSERWQSSPNTKGGFASPHRNGRSSGYWSSRGGRSSEQRKQNANLRNVPYSFDVRGGRSRTTCSNRRSTDQKPGKGEGPGAAAEYERFKASMSSSVSKTAGKATSDQDQGPGTGNHSVVHSEVENVRRSNSKARSSKSVSKMQNNENLKVVKPSENSKAAFDNAMIPTLMTFSKILPENRATNGKIAPKIGSKSPRMRQQSKFLPNLRQRSESSLSSKGQAASQGAEGSSSSRIQDSSDGNAQTAQINERGKQKHASVRSDSGTVQEAVQSSETDCRSAIAGVRPKVDILMRKKRASELSKVDLMKLISSPRSRQEHMQLNRILQAHAEKQKTSMQHAATSETEEHEDLEPSSDHSGFFKEIEVSALPLEIQREIDLLCQGIADVNHTEHSNDVSIIDLSDIADESLSVSRDSPSKNAAPNANIASLQDLRAVSLCRVSATVLQSQCGSPEMQSRSLSSACLVTAEENPGTFSVPSVSRVTCQPNVSHSPLVSTGETRSRDDQSDLPVTVNSVTSSAVASGVTICSSSLTERVQSPATASTDSQEIVNESRTDQGGMQSLGTLLQISLREEEIRGRLKETEGTITSLEEQLKQIKEQLSIKLSLKDELTEEKVRLRSLRLQILRESISHQQEDSTVDVTPVSERLASVPYESIMEVTPSGVEYHPPDQNIPPADSSCGFDSVLRNGVINIEPVNDDYESGLDDGETVCPQYENSGTVQLITIAPTEGGDFSDEDERMQGSSSGYEHSTAAVPSMASAQMREPSIGLQHCDDAHQVLPVPDLDNTISVEMEYVGTLSTSNLQPEVLQQIALSLQPLDAQRVPFSSSSVASIHEFSCSEDEAVEISGGEDRTLEPNTANKKKTVEPRTGTSSQPVVREMDDCVISRVEKAVSRKQSRGLSECEPTAGSASAAVSGKVVPSRGRTASGERTRAVSRAQRLASTSHAIPIADEMASSDTACNLIETPRTVPLGPPATPRPSSAKRLPATVSLGNIVPSFDRLCFREPGEATKAVERCGKNASKRRATDDPIERKRKGAISSTEPPVKRRKSLENPNQQKTPKTKGLAITSIYPRAYPGVLYRHAESARSIVVGDEVVITASDDGQIVRHPLPRQVYGLAEKQTFTGHQRGVVGLITTKVQVTRDISRTVALSIGRDQLLKMHCIQTGKVLKTHKFDKSFCYDCICEANDTIYVGMDDGRVARIMTSSFVAKEPFVFPGSSRISALASFSDDVRSMLLVGFGDCSIAVRDTSNNSFIQTLRGHVRAPRFILTLNDRIISSSSDCWVFVHCLKSTNALVNTIHLPAPVGAMTIQPKHELLVVACRNRTVTFIDVKQNLRYIIRLSTIEFPMTCLAASHHMVYFGCNNGLVHHVDIDMTRHWSCGFNGCKDWFLLKGDLEDHIREDHFGSIQPILVNGQYKNICSWRGCKLSLSCKKRNQKTLAHFLGHITNLEAETTPRGSAVTN